MNLSNSAKFRLFSPGIFKKNWKKEEIKIIINFQMKCSQNLKHNFHVTNAFYLKCHTLNFTDSLSATVVTFTLTLFLDNSFRLMNLKSGVQTVPADLLLIFLLDMANILRCRLNIMNIKCPYYLTEIGELGDH